LRGCDTPQRVRAFPIPGEPVLIAAEQHIEHQRIGWHQHAKRRPRAQALRHRLPKGRLPVQHRPERHGEGQIMRALCDGIDLPIDDAAILPVSRRHTAHPARIGAHHRHLHRPGTQQGRQHMQDRAAMRLGH
jgi:hypothetical protein